MSISENPQKGKQIEPETPLLDQDLPNEEEFDIVPVNTLNKDNLGRHVVNIILIILLASASFGLGKFSQYKDSKIPVTISSDKTLEVPTKATQGGEVKSAVTSIEKTNGEEVIASKNGTKYHYPWCSGGKTILEANKITFSSIEEARKAGYTPAANCKGLK